MQHTNDRKRFTGLFGVVARHPRLVLGVSLLLAVLSVLYTWQEMSFLTGRDDLMPKNAPFQQDYRANRAEFGDREEIVVVVESGDQARASGFAERLAADLSADRTRFRDVFHPNGLPFFREHGLLLLPLDELRSLRENLTLAEPVLKDLASTPSVQIGRAHV